MVLDHHYASKVKICHSDAMFPQMKMNGEQIGLGDIYVRKKAKRGKNKTGASDEAFLEMAFSVHLAQVV